MPSITFSGAGAPFLDPAWHIPQAVAMPSGDQLHAAPRAASRMEVPALRFRALSLIYEEHWLFQNLSLTAEAGACTVLLGASGTGKTSLLKIAAGILQPQAGEACADDGRPLAGRVAYMAQQDLLFPWLTVHQNVMLGARLRGSRPDPARAQTLLTEMGLGGREHAFPAALSGGMRQRAALARTLYENRPIILMDEPFSALDALTRARLQDLAADCLQGRTALLITHDPMEACRLGHFLYVLSGRPARVSAPLTLPGPPPRAVDDAAVVHAQATLLRLLADDAG